MEKFYCALARLEKELYHLIRARIFLLVHHYDWPHPSLTYITTKSVTSATRHCNFRSFGPVFNPIHAIWFFMPIIYAQYWNSGWQLFHAKYKAANIQ